jgi:sugar phosphate isomerase/epimerase
MQYSLAFERKTKSMDHHITRRSMIAAMVATGAIAMQEGPAFAAKGKAFFDRIRKPIGLQLYTLGDDMAKDLDGMLVKVAAIGYRDLELPQLWGKSPADVKAAGDRAGVRFSAIHLAATPNVTAAMLSMKSETQRIIDDLGALGIKDAVLPIMLLPADLKPKQGEGFLEILLRGVVEGGEDVWKRTAALLNEKAAALKPHGITIGYHNHNLEFASIGNTTGWDIMMKELDMSVKLEVDVGWVAAAGLDPVAFLNKHKGRVRWLHVKDVQASTKTNYILKMDPTEVGSGKQNWAKILPAAYNAGVEHFYLEQEAPFSMARIDAAAKGYGFLKGVRA